MRIASNQFQSILSSSLMSNQTAWAKVNQQMSNGTRLLVPSDDPISTVRMSRLEREQSTINQYLDNIKAVQIRMQNNESYLRGMGGDLNEARDLLVGARDGSNTPADLKAKVTPLQALRDSIFYTANIKDQEGRYIFSGTLSNTAAVNYNPAAPSGARYSYTGNTAQQQVVVGNGITQPANSDASGVEAILNQLDAAIDGLNSPTASAADPVLQATLAAGLDGSDVAIDLVAGKVSRLGGAQNIMSTLAENHTNVSLSNQTALTNLGELDYGVAATELAGYETALKATYQAYSTISKLSLFDAI